MIPLFGAAFLVAGFVVLVRAFGLAEKGRAVARVARQSLNVIRNPELSDDDKEAAMKRASRQLFGSFLSIVLRCSAALLLPFVLVWLGDRAGVISLDAVIDVTLSPVFIICSSVAACLAIFWKPRTSATDVADGYTATDRLLHRLAFRTTTAQIGLADIEDRLFAKQLENCDADRPVFVTALPRAGTTLLLECLARLPEFAAHCYRDMPFVLVPAFWGRYCAAFRRTAEARERAHGDGMMIDFDSPEALEEVLWIAFWKQHYLPDRIRPWGNEPDEEFTDFFANHMRKIIALRRPERSTGVRYASKNNLNIARLPLIRTMFPKAAILIPFRRPLHHAASLLQQHLNFLDIHEKDRFAAEYMRAIGHFDFGVNLRPVDFDGWLGDSESDPRSLTFWLQYWVATYRFLLGGASGATFVSYENLCAQPQREFIAIARAIRCREPDRLLSAAGGIHAVRPREIDASGVPSALLAEAEAIHERLLAATSGSIQASIQLALVGD